MRTNETKRLKRWLPLCTRLERPCQLQVQEKSAAFSASQSVLKASSKVCVFVHVCMYTRVYLNSRNSLRICSAASCFPAQRKSSGRGRLKKGRWREEKKRKEVKEHNQSNFSINETYLNPRQRQICFPCYIFQTHSLCSFCSHVCHLSRGAGAGSCGAFWINTVRMRENSRCYGLKVKVYISHMLNISRSFVLKLRFYSVRDNLRGCFWFVE